MLRMIFTVSVVICFFFWHCGCSSLGSASDNNTDNDNAESTEQQINTLLDTSFGVGGTVNYGGPLSAAIDLTIDSNRIVVVGNSTDTALVNEGMTIWSYTTGGVLDTSFSGDGLVAYNADIGSRGNAVVIDASGNIFVTGSLDYKMAIWKYSPDGELMTDFGEGGIAKYSFYGTEASGEGFDIAIDSDDRIVVAGEIGAAPLLLNTMALWRYMPDGQADTSFGSEGIVLYNDGRESTAFYKLYIYDNASVLTAGDAIAKYNSDGVLDSSFGTNGTVSIDGVGYGLVVDADGTFYVAGGSAPRNGVIIDDLKIWSFLSNGSPNTGFGANGVVTYDEDEGENDVSNQGNSIVIDADGKLLITGWSDARILLLRYLKTGHIDRCGGNVCTYVGRSGSQGMSLVLGSDRVMTIGGIDSSYMKLWRLIDP